MFGEVRILIISTVKSSVVVYMTRVQSPTHVSGSATVDSVRRPSLLEEILDTITDFLGVGLPLLGLSDFLLVLDRHVESRRCQRQVYTGVSCAGEAEI